jgi:hypothetical protein
VNVKAGNPGERRRREGSGKEQSEDRSLLTSLS